MIKGGAANLKGGWGGTTHWKVFTVNTVKTLTFEKGGVHDPPAPMVAPPLAVKRYFSFGGVHIHRFVEIQE